MARSALPELQRIFLREKPVRLMLSLRQGKKYVSVVAKEIDCTYSHVVKLLNQLQRLGLVKFEKQGRVKFVTLTQVGDDVAKAFENVLRKFSSIKAPEK